MDIYRLFTCIIFFDQSVNSNKFEFRQKNEILFFYCIIFEYWCYCSCCNYHYCYHYSKWINTWIEIKITLYFRLPQKPIIITLSNTVNVEISLFCKSSELYNIYQVQIDKLVISSLSEYLLLKWKASSHFVGRELFL